VKINHETDKHTEPHRYRHRLRAGCNHRPSADRAAKDEDDDGEEFELVK
jgi:hypothetical protein